MSVKLPIPIHTEFKDITRPNLRLRYAKIFTASQSTKIFNGLEKEVVYSKDAHVRIYGKVFSIPRKQAGFALEGVRYIYSGEEVETQKWTPLMTELLQYVNTVTKQEYNFILVNRYKDGTDKIGFHSDNEKSIDQSVPIASLTFGAEREFTFRRKSDQTQQVSMVLQNGSLLLMERPTNFYWSHSLPYDKFCKTPRINLTFRKLIS